MTHGRISLPLALCGLAAAALTSCEGSGSSAACSKDTDCPPAFFCDELTAACRCRTDDACSAGQYCNTYGTCQARPPCIGNKDCAEDEICNGADPSGGQCMPAEQCGSSVHCPFNQSCSPSTGECTPGCRNTGDCQLGWVCRLGSCVAGGTDSDCTICPTTPTADPTYCDYGELCRPDGLCAAHPAEAGLCSRCGALSPCADSSLMCLVDEDAHGDGYCTAVCGSDTDCPSGYGGCGGIIIAGEDCTATGTCLNGGECLGSSESNRRFCSCIPNGLECELYPAGLCLLGMCMNSLPCSTDEDCAPYGGTCQATFLGSSCNIPCSSDGDCICRDGRCLGTGFPCTTRTDCQASCNPFPWSDGRAVHLCETNVKACGKQAGVTCDELTRGVSSCRGIEPVVVQ